MFPKTGKGERSGVFHADEIRGLAVFDAGPLEKPVCRNYAAALAESLAKGGLDGDALGAGVEGAVFRLGSVAYQACAGHGKQLLMHGFKSAAMFLLISACLLYTSDAADE